MVFHRSLNDSKSPGLFSVFWPISRMLKFGWSLLVLLFPSPPVFVLIFWWFYQVHQVQLVSPSLLCSIVFLVLEQGLSTCLSFYFLSVLPWVQPEQQSSLFGKLLFFFFFLTITRSGHLAEIRWSVCISKFQRILSVSFSRMDSRLCIYHLFVWSNLNFLHNSQWITLPNQSCLVLYTFCATLLHSLIMWLIVSDYNDE